jgi:hypothetical protein
MPGLRSADDDNKALGGGAEPVDEVFSGGGGWIIVADMVSSGIAPHAAAPILFQQQTNHRMSTRDVFVVNKFASFTRGCLSDCSPEHARSRLKSPVKNKNRFHAAVTTVDFGKERLWRVQVQSPVHQRHDEIHYWSCLIT